MDATQAGNADLDERFRELAPWLERVLRRRCNHDDVEDVVQESFVRLARYEPHQRNLRPRALLLRIAGNLLHDAGRRAVARRHAFHLPLDGSGADRCAVSADQHAHVALKQAILGLPEPFRETFLLSRFTPLTNAEIATRLGVSTKTIEWRIGRAMALCLAELEG